MPKAELTLGELRTAFGIIVLTGLGFTILTALGALTVFWVLFIPLATMGLYFYWYWRRSKLRHHLDQFADSFYYAGFLYTLFSLAGSFLPWVLEPAALSSSDILARFGVALSTTLLGLSIRVWLTQFRHGTDEVDAQTRSRIGEATRDLNTEIRVAVEVMRTLRKTMSAELEDLQTDVGERLRTNAEQISASLKTPIGTLTQQLEEFTESIGRLGESTKGLVLAFAEA